MRKAHPGNFGPRFRPSAAAFSAIVAHLLWVILSAGFSVPALAQMAPVPSTSATPEPSVAAQCDAGNNYLQDQRYDGIVIGAGIAGLSAARELKHLGRKVVVLEANDRIGGRGYVGFVGDERVPIDYGGSWLHGVATNPLTGLVDADGFQRFRTELNLPYYVNEHQADEDQKERFYKALERYEEAACVAAATEQRWDAVVKYTCPEEEKDLVPRSRLAST